MKKILTILAALLTAFGAQAQDTYQNYLFVGNLPEDAGSVTINASRRERDNLLLGKFYWDECPYDIAGFQDRSNPNVISADIFRYGYKEGHFIGQIDDKGNYDGNITINDFTSGFHLEYSAGEKSFEYAFVHPTINDMERYSLFSMAEIMADFNPEDVKTTNLVLERQNGSLAFRCVGGISDGLGTINVDDNNSYIREAFEYTEGCFSYENAPNYLEFELFDDVLVVHFISEEPFDESEPTIYSMVDGIYSLKCTQNDFTPWYFKPDFYYFEGGGEGENDDEEWDGEGDIAWAVRGHYGDVAQMAYLINTGRILDEKFPVAVADGAKTNIDLYFRAIADAFKNFEGLFMSARPVAQPDMKNGYLKVNLPDAIGDEGIEMCFWRGKDGKDVVALELRYDVFDVHHIDPDRVDWTLIFFQYDPATKTLSYLVSCDKYGDNVSVDKQHGFGMEMPEVYDVQLPQVGKTIKFINAAGREVYSCEWSADIQWFAWG